jgi:hypothetical protein
MFTQVVDIQNFNVIFKINLNNTVLLILYSLNDSVIGWLMLK